ncbi:hypothetical protein LOK46_22160 [Methylobacterium sp. NMS14P]|nr:hypothetical protein [Methylobacterium sp. NMS14P]WCS28269.1 hypothetical protein LOK46_22160 [Methylobacterium sp. NMS14P]
MASLHVHRNRDACLDVAVLRGPVARMQSYADAVVTQRGVRYGHLHLIPELVGAVEFHKGPYFVRDGDLRLRGPGRIDSLDSVPKNLALTTVGSFGDERGPSIASLPLGEGTLLVAGAARFYDGPWAVPDALRKLQHRLPGRHRRASWRPARRPGLRAAISATAVHGLHGHRFGLPAALVPERPSRR